MSTSEEEVLEPSFSGAGPASAREPGAKLFLGGLSWDTSEEKLTEHFGSYGELIEVVVMRDRGTGRPRGFGFVTYKDPDVADRVVKDTHMVDGRQIDTKKSVPQESKPKARKIFVGGLAPETTEVEFEEYFSKFGKVAEVQIMQDHMSGRSRGFGFVTFEEDSSAQEVFEVGTMHELGGKRVEVKPATPKGTGPQTSRTTTPIAPSGVRGRSSSEYDPASMMTFAAPIPGSPAFGAYSMYGYAGRPGMVAGPYGMPPQYTSVPQPMMMMPHPHPQAMGYAAAPPFGGYPPQGFSGGVPGRNQGGAAAPIPFSRPSYQEQQQRRQQQQQQGYYRQPPESSSPSLSPPYLAGSKAPSGRNKVDSASSLDQHAQQLKNLSLE